MENRLCLITITLAYDNSDGYTRCRYLDIGLGVVLLVSMLALLQGGWSLQPAPLVIFLTLSLAVLVSYWIWYLYVNIIATNYPVFEEQVRVVKQCCMYVFLDNPFCTWAYRHLSIICISYTFLRSGRSGVP